MLCLFPLTLRIDSFRERLETFLKLFSMDQVLTADFASDEFISLHSGSERGSESSFETLGEALKQNEYKCLYVWKVIKAHICRCRIETNKVAKEITSPDLRLCHQSSAPHLINCSFVGH